MQSNLYFILMVQAIVLGVKMIIDTHRYFEFRFLTFGFCLAILLHVL